MCTLCRSTAGEVPRADGDAVMPELSWARLKTDLHLGLRRGAWYRVIRATGGQVILDVDHQPVTVLCEYLEFVSVRPDRWTIVERPSDVAGAAASWGQSYGVCPHCTHREPLVHPVVEAGCSRCRGTFRSEEHTSELQSRRDLVCRLLLEKKK